MSLYVYTTHYTRYLMLNVNLDGRLTSRPARTRRRRTAGRRPRSRWRGRTRAWPPTTPRNGSSSAPTASAWASWRAWRSTGWARTRRRAPSSARWRAAGSPAAGRAPCASTWRATTTPTPPPPTTCCATTPRSTTSRATCSDSRLR